MGFWGSRPRRGGWSFLLVPALTALAAGVRAESAVVVIAPPGRSGPVDAARAVQRILDEQGAAALSDATVLARLERILRLAPPRAADAGATLARDRNDVLEAVAFGRDGEAIALGAAVLEREERRLGSTNTSDTAARDLGDICLFLVRAEFHRGDALAARARARECLRLVPDLAPSEELHPPEVRDALNLARREPHGQLRIEAVKTEDAPCSVRVQGRLSLPLPAEVSLLSGRHVVHAECVRSQWLHDIEVKGGETARMSLVPMLEAGLRVQPILTVATTQPREMAVLFDWLAIEDLWVVRADAGQVTIALHSRSGSRGVARGVRAVPIAPESSLQGRLRRAVAALSCLDVPCHKRATSSPSARLVGFIGAGAGGAAMAVSWVAFGRYHALDGEYVGIATRDAVFQDVLDSRNAWRATSLTTSIAGSVVFAAAASLWLPERERMPWWATAVGAAGISAIGLGAAVWADAQGEKEPTACPTPDCFRYRTGVPLGPLLISQGAALLSLPATYLMRGLLRSDSGALELGGAAGEVRVAWTQRLGL